MTSRSQLMAEDGVLTTWEQTMNDKIRGLGLALATSVLMLLVGCVAPAPAPSYPSQYDNQMLATVDGVDLRSNLISVFVNDPRSGRSQRREVRYDQRTRLFYQGREQAVDGLERGDVIRIDIAQSGRELWARSIEVVRNVRDRGYRDDYGHGNDLRGSVTFVDTRARLIRLDGAGYGNASQVTYDARTTVEYQGRSYRPENLQRGDLVRIQARQVANNQWLAERIFVERSTGR